METCNQIASQKTTTITRWTWGVFWAFLCARLAVIGFLGLGDDEAHYWQYAHYLNLSYFDHPPMIAYIIKLFTFFGGNHEFFVRLPTVLLSACTQLVLWRLTLRLFSSEILGFWVIVLFNVTPVFSFLGGVLTVPDTPLSVFWMLYIFFFYRIIETGKANYWYLLGVFLGLGLLSKYNAILLPLSAGIFLMMSPTHRHWMRRKEFFASLFIACIIFLPVVLWNLQNDFASFGFQLRHGFGSNVSTISFSPNLLSKCLGAQAGYISPFLFFIVWYAIIAMFVKWYKQHDEKFLFLFSMSFPTLIFFNAITCFREILPHWPALGYLTGLIAAAYCIASWKKKWFVYFSMSFGLLLIAIVLAQALFKAIPLPPKVYDVTDELYGWNQIGRVVDAAVRTTKNATGMQPIISTHRHYLASQLGFYVPNHPKIYCFNDRLDQYDFWQRGTTHKGPALFITDSRFLDDPNAMYAPNHFVLHYEIPIYRKGRVVKKAFIYVSRDFDTTRMNPERIDGAIPAQQSIRDAIKKLDMSLFLIINNKLNCTVGDIVFGAATLIGYGWPLFLVGSLVLFFYNRKKFLHNTLMLFIALISSGIVSQLLKHVFDTPRPLRAFETLIQNHDVVVYTLFHPLYARSFPSGHSATGFAAAWYLSYIIPSKAVLFFVIAIIIAISRVYVGAHFVSDIVAGTCIGCVCAATVVYVEKRGTHA